MIYLRPPGLLSYQRQDETGGGDPLANLRQGLVNWWELDEASGTRVDVVDGHNLADSGTTTPRDVIDGSGADFTGSTYFIAPTRANYPNITIAAWVEADSFSGFYNMIASDNDYDASSLNSAGWWFARFASGKWGIGYASGGSFQEYNTNTFPDAPTGTRVLVMAHIDFDAGTVGISVDGAPWQEVSTNFASYNRTPGQSVVIGRYKSAAPYSFDGGIGRVVLWDRKLTNDQVSEFYNNGNGVAFTPSTFSGPDSIPGLASWLDAAETSTMTDETNTPVVSADGDTFTRWQEGLAASPVAARWQGPSNPSSNTGAEWVENANGSGFPAVIVRGSTDQLRSEDGAGSDLRCYTQEMHTAFCVASSTDTGGADVFYAANSFSGGSAGGILLRQDRSSSRYLALTFSPIYGGTWQLLPSEQNDANLRVLAARCRGAGNTSEAWFNGASQGTVSLSANGIYHQPFGASTLFHTNGMDQDYFIHELLVYDRALTDAEIANVNNYLTAKYGL
jgi:hypothetical protein